MKQKEFIEYVNQHTPSTLGKITPEHLKRWNDLGVLRPHGEYYNHQDIQQVLGLLQLEEQSKKQASKGDTEPQKIQLSSFAGPIYQVLSIIPEVVNEAQLGEMSKIHKALVKTGLISTLGEVYINFSTLTGNTLESLLAIPAYKARFEQAAAAKELLVFRDAIQFEIIDTGDRITYLTPVIFINGVEPKVIYSTLIFGGHGRLIGPQQYMRLPNPLYEELLHLDARSMDDILKFMVDHIMIGSLGVPYGKDAIDLVKTTQEKMRNLLLKASKGSIEVADLSLLFPFHEDDVISTDKLSEMGGIDIFNAEGKPVSLGEIKISPAYKREGHEWVPYNQNNLHISRYYSWLDYMWAEFINAITSGSQIPLCLRCGSLIPQPKTGRRKLYCGAENPKCYLARKAENTRKSRDRRM